jgi:hypothetical protein
MQSKKELIEQALSVVEPVATLAFTLQKQAEQIVIGEMATMLSGSMPDPITYDRDLKAAEETISQLRGIWSEYTRLMALAQRA